MRATERRSPRLTLAVRSLRRSQPSPAASDDAPLGAAIGGLVGVLFGVSLWGLIAVIVMLLRRL
jgi:hypothetical protein